MIPITEVAKKLGYKSTDPIYNKAKKGLITIIVKGLHKRYISEEDFARLSPREVPSGMKKCKQCGYEDSIENHQWCGRVCHNCMLEFKKEIYHKDKKKNKLKRQIYCKLNSDRELARASEYYCKNKEKVRIRKLCKLYNITETKYFEMKILYQNKCEICNKYDEKLQVDHNHDTGEVRGLLCKLCNSGIGHLKDNPILIKSALEYLIKYENHINDDEIMYSAYFYSAKKGVLPIDSID